MIWQETTGELARSRQQSMLDDAESQRAALIATRSPRYREWLALQLVNLALCLAPTMRDSLPVSSQNATPASLTPVATGKSLSRLS